MSQRENMSRRRREKFHLWVKITRSGENILRGNGEAKKNVDYYFRPSCFHVFWNIKFHHCLQITGFVLGTSFLGVKFLCNTQ